MTDQQTTTTPTTMFKSDLEKEVWIAVFTRLEPDGIGTKQRMVNAWELVLELRESFEKLLAFGAWTKAAAEIVGEDAPSGSVFQNEMEKRIWISAFARPVGKSDANTYNSAKKRATRAWEFVLEFRQPDKSDAGNWERAAREISQG